MSLRNRTAGALKWNIVDRVSTQVLYAVTGIVLANLLSQEDFGLVGAVLVFQAFASLFVDSGFSYALLQKQRPTRLDYSSVLWFNLGSATLLYVVLFAGAPLVADCFGGDARLIPLSRLMFLSLILNASMTVQINRLMKAMDVRIVAMANTIGLVAGGVVGIWLAVIGAGAWAIVWQSLVMLAVKSLILWVASRWRPLMCMSWGNLRAFLGLGSKMMFSSFLNTLFLYIYSFVIGNRLGLTALGYYTQADKWSKMGTSSLSQVLTSTFVPTLSAVQDQPERFVRLCSKMNRLTAYILLPAMIGLTVMAPALFHTLFGTKWDASISLFQILLLRGIFVVLISLYTNYLLAKGHGHLIVRLEVARDVLALIVLAAALPYMSLTTPDNPVYGVSIMLVGQLAVSVAMWIATLVVTARAVDAHSMAFLRDLVPYVAMSLLIVPVVRYAAAWTDTAILQFVSQLVIGVVLYIGMNALLGSAVQRQAFDYIRGKF